VIADHIFKESDPFLRRRCFEKLGGNVPENVLERMLNDRVPSNQTAALNMLF